MSKSIRRIYSYISRFKHLPIFFGKIMPHLGDMLMGATISGIAVFIIASLFSISHYWFLLMILGGFVVAAYTVWRDEYERVNRLEEERRPKMELQFDPKGRNFVSEASAAIGARFLYVRVRPRCLSPVVNNCQGYLEAISKYDGEKWVILFDESLPLMWSNDERYPPEPKQLNREVAAYLDVLWFNPGTKGFGLISPYRGVPNNLHEILTMELAHPGTSFKVDVLVTAENSAAARLSLAIQPGEIWNKPQIGWLDSIGEIHIHDSTKQPDSLTSA